MAINPLDVVRMAAGTSVMHNGEEWTVGFGRMVTIAALELFHEDSDEGREFRRHLTGSETNRDDTILFRSYFSQEAPIDVRATMKVRAEKRAAHNSHRAESKTGGDLPPMNWSHPLADAADRAIDAQLKKIDQAGERMREAISKL